MTEASYRQDGDVGELVLDAPPLNLFSAAMFDDLEAAIAHALEAAPRALIFRAQGDVVSAGVDVHVFEGLAPSQAGALWERLLVTVSALEGLPCPTVFAAHGLCLTAAFEIALACDLLVAAERAQFGLVERVVGLTPSMGGPQRLTERAGAARARQLVYSGDRFDAATLECWGVVTAVWPDDEFATQSRALAARLADGPTLAHAATKRLVRAAAREGVGAADALVPEVSGALFATEDLQGAVASFLREGPGKARFHGR